MVQMVAGFGNPDFGQVVSPKRTHPSPTPMPTSYICWSLLAAGGRAQQRTDHWEMNPADSAIANADELINSVTGASFTSGNFIFDAISVARRHDQLSPGCHRPLNLLVVRPCHHSDV